MLLWELMGQEKVNTHNIFVCAFLHRSVGSKSISFAPYSVSGKTRNTLSINSSIETLHLINSMINYLYEIVCYLIYYWEWKKLPTYYFKCLITLVPYNALKIYILITYFGLFNGTVWSIGLELFRPKMSSTLSLSGMHQKSSIYHRNRTNSQ